MSRYADLNVKCSKKTANEVISALRVFPYETMGSGRWEIAVEAMERSASMALDPFIYWNYRQKKGSEIYALLALFYSPGEYSLEDGKLWVANVVPVTKSELKPDEYNPIVQQFNDEVLAPILSKNWPSLKCELIVPNTVQPPVTIKTIKPTQRRFIDFIIGQDKFGNDIWYSCDPDGLADYFGKNAGAPNFLTAVFFKSAVLDKYRDMPSKYDVESGCLRCKGSDGVEWCMPLDNHGESGISVWLGDLGRELPYDEQLHFASYNISKGRMSEAFIKSQIDAVFCSSPNPIHVFKNEYRALYDTYADELGWVLILPLPQQDRYLLDSLKLLTCDEQKEFDEQIRALAKIVVESLNVDELKKFVVELTAPGGINLLEAVLQAKGIVGYEKHILFLRNLQGLRSTSVAHRKGEKYEKLSKRIGLDRKSKSEVFCELVKAAIEFFRYMQGQVNKF